MKKSHWWKTGKDKADLKRKEREQNLKEIHRIHCETHGGKKIGYKPEEVSMGQYLDAAMRMVINDLERRNLNTKHIKYNNLIRKYAEANKLNIVGNVRKWVIQHYLTKPGVKPVLIPVTKRERRLRSTFEGLENTKAREYCIENIKAPTAGEARFKFLFSYTKIPYVTEHAIKREDNNSFYLIDFYIPDFGIAVEIDGGYHTSPEQIEKDRIRDSYLSSKGMKVVRITNDELFAIKKVKLLVDRLGIKLQSSLRETI